MLIIALYLALSAFLVVFLISRNRGAKEPTPALWVAFGFGLLAVGIAWQAEKLFVPNGLVLAVLAQVNLGRLWWISTLIGLVEEAAKFIPLALWLRRRRYFNKHTDGVIYFALSGLAFGLLENLLYSAHFGEAVGLQRAVLLLFLHPATSGIVGYYFVRCKIRGESLLKPLAALVGVAGLHGLYNFGVLSQRADWVALSILVTALINLGLFIYYSKAIELDQAFGVAAVGRNNFCRHCGRQNLKHFLFCEFCGRHS
jgi:RsiW-degrading membrane proteinase PrsW (M82 family)